MSESIFGKVGYETYYSYADNKSLVTGCELPKWDDLKPEIKAAWIEAASSITKLWDVVNVPYGGSNER